MPRIVLLGNSENELIGAVGIFGPMHLYAVALAAGFELFQQVRQLGQYLLANLFAFFAELFPGRIVRYNRCALCAQKLHGTAKILA